MNLNESKFESEILDLRSDLDFLDHKIKKLEDAFSYTIGEIQFRLNASDLNEKKITEEEKNKMLKQQELERLAFKAWMEGNHNG